MSSDAGSQELNLKNPLYDGCLRHPKTDQVVNVTIKGHEANYCLTCLAEWYDKNLPKVQVVIP